MCTPGINVRKPIAVLADDEVERVLDVNLKGTFWAMRAAARVMRARGKGSIVVLSSIRSQVVEPGQGIYAATKAGLVQLARTLAAELGARGVRVNAVAPGVVETPLTGPIRSQPSWYEAYARKSALGRWAQPREIAGPIVFLLSRRRELRHRHGAVRRRRLDRDRRQVRAAGHGSLSALLRAGPGRAARPRSERSA